jgi:hypothetical protein
VDIGESRELAPDTPHTRDNLAFPDKETIRMSNFVISLSSNRDSDRAPLFQTFTFGGETTLDQAFAEIERRDRSSSSFAEIAARRRGKHRVFSLIVNRDQSDEEPDTIENILRDFDRVPGEQGASAETDAL